MTTLQCRYRYWIFCILFLHNICIIPISSQDDCILPLTNTKYESITKYDGCGLICNSDNAATPWTDRKTNKNITILFLAFLIPAFLCNLVFTFNNISEHRENEETFQTTPITYDSLFVIDVAYLLVIICLIIPSLSYFDGGNTVSSTYICNYNEQTLSINNPTNSSNGLCTLFGLFIFSTFKILLIYAGIVCVNIWYRLWKPMVDVGIQKRYIHGVSLSIVFIFDIIILAVGGIDANPSNGICYISMDNTALLLVMDIIPNLLFIIISAVCVAHAVRQLKQEMTIIKSADLVTDDLVNLIHRMTGFLVMAVVSSAFIVFTEIIWLSFNTLYKESTMEWIDCAQDKVLSYDGDWKYEIGDQCIEELKEDGFVFPNELFFIAFPIAALLSNVAIIILTCHRRQYDRWHRAILSCKHIYHKLSICHFQNKWKNRPEQPQIRSLIESSNNQHESTIALKGSGKNDAISVPNKSPSALSPDEDYSNKRTLSVKVRHSPQNSSNDVEEIGTVRYNEETGQTEMTFVGDTPTQTETDLPGFQDSNTMIRHPTDSKNENENENESDIEEYERQVAKQEALENKDNKLAVDEQTEMLIQFDRHKSEQGRDKLEHIANASFDYHNLTKQGKSGVPISKLLNRLDSSEVVVDEEDINKSEEVTARLQSLQLSDSIPKDKDIMGGKRSKTVPNLLKRTSTQKHFVSFLEDALQDSKRKDLLKQQSKSTKSVRFMDESNSNMTIPTTPTSPNDEDHLVAKKVANVILRSATDGIVKKIQAEEDVETQKQKDKRRKLKKSKTSIDATKAFNDEIIKDIESKEDSDEEPAIGDRRLSEQQRAQLQVKQVTERHKNTFLNRFGKRKKAKQIMKIKKLQLKKKNTLLRFAEEFFLSSGTKMFEPSSLLKPVCMESQYNLNHELYFDEESRTDTFETEDTFDSMMISEDDTTIGTSGNSSNNTLDVLNYSQQAMQWQSMTNIFHFTLTDNEFKEVLHSTFTPHSTRMSRRMTFDPDDPFGENNNNGIIIKEDEETIGGTPLSKLKTTKTQSAGNLQSDRSVTGIGSDGKIVLSDIGRFKGFGGHASSVPLNDNNMLSEDEEYEYDIKYDDDEMVKKTKKKKRELRRKESHHRNETLHGRLLDSVPHADRKDLSITIHPDFSCEVAEKKKHYKAETAKLAFTLKPVHSMKILL